MNTLIKKKNKRWIIIHYFLSLNIVLPLLLGLFIKDSQVVSYLLYVGYFIYILVVCKDYLIDLFRYISNYFLGLLGRSAIRYPVLFLSALISSILVSALLDNQVVNNQDVIQDMIYNNAVFGFFLVCIFAPLVEEIIFRSIIFQGLKDKYNRSIAYIVSSLFFGFLHIVVILVQKEYYIALVSMIPYAAMGFVLAYFYEKEQHVAGSYLLHFIQNTIGFLLILNL
ncbi:CPBP family intramembrane metalloprotease [Erysipelotrichaceae bacterium OH741_COT-311]|nr:CPBP family intramembrane metalloprotease [Erysipelotrichaceae bacterium OH741_COT-311]